MFINGKRRRCPRKGTEHRNFLRFIQYRVEKELSHFEGKLQNLDYPNNTPRCPLFRLYRTDANKRKVFLKALRGEGAVV